jgi:outer membrane protein
MNRIGRAPVWLAAALAIAAAATGRVAMAEEAGAADDVRGRSLYVRVGPAGLFFIPSTTLRVGGNEVPGADVGIGPNFTGVVEVGWFPLRDIPFVEDLAVSLTVGVPPKGSITGSGSVASAGTLGKAIYGPATLTVHYHLRTLPYVKPYLGLGLNYTIIFSSEDGAVMNLKVDSALGFVLQAGIDVPIGDRWGVYADAKMIFVSTTANGTFSGMPATADITANPLVLSLGGSFRF